MCGWRRGGGVGCGCLNERSGRVGGSRLRCCGCRYVGGEAAGRVGGCDVYLSDGRLT